jgi:hypothetical protein
MRALICKKNNPLELLFCLYNFLLENSPRMDILLLCAALWEGPELATLKYLQAYASPKLSGKHGQAEPIK